jgi:dissimilatory sulfite reductase (desulfoviridin) alpha/beta subunit
MTWYHRRNPIREDRFMDWTEEALDAVSSVPFFVRKRVKIKVEQEARGAGAAVVGLEHVTSCRKKFLNRMEDEVKGYQVETCFGPGGCPNRAFEAEDLSRVIEERMARRNLKAFLKERVKGPLKLHHEFRISISECPNGCSRPQIADVGLLGALVPEVSEVPCTGCGECMEACREKALSLEGAMPRIDQARCLYCGECVNACPTGTLRAGLEGFRIQVGGKLGRHPRLATELSSVFSVEETLERIDACPDHYQANCRSGERFGEILERMGTGMLEP